MTGSRTTPTHVLDALFAVPRPVASLGRAIWLFAALIRHAGYGGTVIRTQARLAEELGVTETDVTAWLDRIVMANLVRVQSPLPYLVCRVVSWSGEGAEPSVPASDSPAFPKAHIEDSYGNAGNNRSGNQAIAGIGGAGERDLAALAREVLGPDIEAELPAILARHSEDRIRRAIDKVRGTPPEKIRKSRVALFRYLISKLPPHP